MNCNEVEKKIMLAGTGELAGRDLDRLRKHIAICKHCRDYQKSVEMITDLARRELSVEGPSEFVLANISVAASAHISPRRVAYPSFMVQMLAYAAVVALLIGSWFAMSPRSVDGGGKVAELGAIMSVISDEYMSTATDRNEALNELAERLLIMQGFIDDSYGSAEYQDVAPSPTVLRSHNKNALHS